MQLLNVLPEQTMNELAALVVRLCCQSVTDDNLTRHYPDCSALIMTFGKGGRISFYLLPGPKVGTIRCRLKGRMGIRIPDMLIILWCVSQSQSCLLPRLCRPL